ncbi:MAG: hypothetical protein ACOX6O_00875 [Christensenellales bacterium]|jgi:hypothetical protein
MDMDKMYTSRLFLYAVLPLVKEIGQAYGYFNGRSGVLQISVTLPEGDEGLHFILKNGEVETKLGLHESPDVSLHFSTQEHFNRFFLGKTKKLPKINGFAHLGLLIAAFRTLLKMADLLSAKAPPQDEKTKELVVRLYLYLLSRGISRLNLMGHPQVQAWTKPSPNRVYAWQVDGYPETAAHLRVKAGKTKAAKGRYTRSQPFFTMRFADLDSALAILLQTGDFIALTAQEKLMLDGAPEFGAKIGDFMQLVGSYVQG